MIHRIWAVALNTFRETMRDRVLLGVLVFAVGIIAFSVFLGTISLEQNRKIMIDVGLAAIFLLQLFITVFIGASLIYREIDRRTFFMILPKPIGYSEVLLGKAIGLSLTNLVMTIFTTAVLGVVLKLGGAGFSGAGAILLAIGMGLVETVLVLLVSLMLSSLTSPILAAIYTSAIVLIGHSADFIFAATERQPYRVVKYAILGLYYIFPNFEKFNLRNDAVYGMMPSLGFIGTALLYALAYGIFLFIAARWVFSRREY